MIAKTIPKENKFMRYMKAPARILARARDLYVRSLTSCAGNLSYGSAAVGGPTLPRSFSVNSTYSDHSSRDEDFRELVRFASTRSLTGKIEAELLRSTLGAGGLAAVPRSRTVAIGRIDEDKPYEFGEHDVVAVYPRSKSYAPPKRSSMV